MKKDVLMFLLSLSVTFVFGQDQSIADSLIESLSKYERGEKEKLEVLVRIAQNQNDPDLRLFYAEQLLSECEHLANNFNYLHHVYLQIGQAHRLKGNYEEAIQSLFKSLAYAKKEGSHKNIAGVLTALGDAYSTLGEQQKAISFYKQSINENQNHDSDLLAVTLINLGDTYYTESQYDSSLRCFEESLKIYKSLDNDPSGVAYNLGNIGLVLAEQGSFKEAQKNLKSAINDFEQLEDHYAIAVFLGYMADIFQDKGYFDEAISFADSSLLVARKYGFKTEIRDNLRRLTTFYEGSGNYQKALNYHRLFVEAENNIASAEVYSRIENLEDKYELVQKESELKLLQEKQTKQQAILIAVSLVLLAFITLLIVIYKSYRNKTRVNKLLEEQKASLERLNETKDKFFSIISHDIRGPINSFSGFGKLIKHLLNKDDKAQLVEIAEETEETANRLSSLLDSLLTWALQQRGHFPNVPEKVNLHEMFDQIVAMFANMVHAKRLQLTCDVNPDIQLWVDRNSTHTIFRNLISNAIKFTDERGNIFIESHANGANAEIFIKDTGVGISKEKLKKLFKLNAKKSTYGTSGEKGLGLGLQLVYEFLEMNNGSIEVSSAENEGTTFSISLPLFEHQHTEVSTTQ